MPNFKKKLRKEISENLSGSISHSGRILYLKENHYFIEEIPLDGDAPKEFIHAYFYEKNSLVRKAEPNTWKTYIAKSAEKWYPHESIIEFLVNRIGQVLGLNMNKVKLVTANLQIRFLSEYFLEEGYLMIHGAEICGEYLEDYDLAREIANDKNSARELFSFEFLKEAIQHVFPLYQLIILDKLVELITFDAVVGNNDRHFYNWAVISPLATTKEEKVFSPIYDSARGLLWNWSDERVIKAYKNMFLKGKKIYHYIQKASPRISIEGNSNINHFDLVKHIYQTYPEYQETISSLLTLDKQESVKVMIQKEFSQFFIKERNFLVNYIIDNRFNTLRNLINE